MADESKNVDTEQKATESETKPIEQAQTDYESKLQALMIENAKLKKAMDKATSEASSFKKQLREKQTESEIAQQEKAEREAEREAELQALIRENKINRLEKSFLELGYSAEQATRASEAQFDGDTDALFKIQSEVLDGIIKTKEAEWLKSRPPVNAGGGESTDKNGIAEKFANASYSEVLELKAKYPKEYDAYFNKGK